MRSIVIAYDLVGTSETSADYKRLIERIKSYPNWAKLQKSMWVVRTDLSAREVRDDVWRFMDADDRLFVCVLTGEAWWFNVICDSDWLIKNL
jgi:hypothetical protein